MTTSLSNHGRSARLVDGFEEDPYGEGNPDEARLRGLGRQQLADRLNWLSWYQPGIFAAVMDYGQFSDDLAADTDPTSPALAPCDDFGNLDYADDPAPYCAICDGDIGIFLKFGLDWRHYTGTGLTDIELLDPGHAPVLAWRPPGMPA
jgi:hypothetical protein